ncbi:FCD domain-containing protein [Myxococcus sp. K15C18031901]|uniref:FadR/GntR family transcriptional regulator n=1 Tax=Myxococcus dinghuensis TaxID=2906761 RepID=UPI0020A774BE|nr:FCD domain-containing protein [Myxococcus dinghuensis]MCP3103021.1 FCD domain-containing protein [Myxococcus dinghuensis]
MVSARPFQAVVRNPLYLQVAERIREAILSGGLAVGDALPPERELAEQFGVSRASIREALRALQAQGLVEGKGKGLVARAASGLLSEALTHVVRLRLASLEDLVELRCVVEAAALERAARRGAPGRLDAARQALEAMCRPDVTVEAFHEADVRFHIELVAASGNRAMHLVMLAMRDAMSRHLLEALRAAGPGVMRRLAEEHVALLDAVERGDAEGVSQRLREHIQGFYEGSVVAPAAAVGR